MSPISLAAAVAPQSTPLAPEAAAEGDSSTAGNEAQSCDVDLASESEPSSDEPAKPPNAIVKQLHQLTALSLLQSSQPVNHSKSIVNRIYTFQKVCKSLSSSNSPS